MRITNMFQRKSHTPYTLGGYIRGVSFFKHAIPSMPLYTHAETENKNHLYHAMIGEQKIALSIAGWYWRREVRIALSVVHIF